MILCEAILMIFYGFWFDLRANFRNFSDFVVLGIIMPPFSSTAGMPTRNASQQDFTSPL
jgi:hypothetical protein